MFRKKKPQPDAPRRQRPQPDQSRRNTAVFSYYTARSRRDDNAGRGSGAQQPQQSPRGKRKRLTPRRLVHLLVLVAVLGLAMHSTLVTPEPDIVAVGEREQQAFLQDDQVYEQAAATLIAASLRNRNKLTFDTAQVSSQMQEHYPELAEVSVSLPLFGQQPTVYIQAFTPKLIMEGHGGTFVLDREGRAFLPGSQVPKLDRFALPVVRDESGMQLEAKRIVLPEQETFFITEVNRQLAAADVEIAGMTLPEDSSELEVQIQDAPYVVRFNLHGGDAREGSGRYLAAREYLQDHGETPESYVDVRVDNRVYYQ